ncbi:hypothetical protein PR048_025878 [Dryococelus australis]|uniref:Uncharacterized protein n=1 Tax=Dryococelus australis TaxID=614101 RepID=A0ABQ9GJR8_9NEOP|nr:hypothetical protein PR048_025878 [Dryococelus australis]
MDVAKHSFAQPGESTALRSLAFSLYGIETASLLFLSDVMQTADAERREIVVKVKSACKRTPASTQLVLSLYSRSFQRIETTRERSSDVTITWLQERSLGQLRHGLKLRSTDYRLLRMHPTLTNTAVKVTRVGTQNVSCAHPGRALYRADQAIAPVDESALCLIANRRNERAVVNKIPEKTRPPAALSGKIPTCENSRVTRPGIDPRFALVGGDANGLVEANPLRLRHPSKPASKCNNGRSLLAVALCRQGDTPKESELAAAGLRASYTTQRSTRLVEKKKRCVCVCLCACSRQGVKNIRDTARPSPACLLPPCRFLCLRLVTRYCSLSAGFLLLLANLAGRPAPSSHDHGIPDAQTEYTTAERAANTKVLRIDESGEQHQIARERETGNPRENPPTSGIVQHDPHIRSRCLLRRLRRVRRHRREKTERRDAGGQGRAWDRRRPPAWAHASVRPTARKSSCRAELRSGPRSDRRTRQPVARARSPLPRWPAASVAAETRPWAARTQSRAARLLTSRSWTCNRGRSTCAAFLPALRLHPLPFSAWPWPRPRTARNTTRTTPTRGSQH